MKCGSEAVENGGDEGVDGVFVVGIGTSGQAVGNDHTTRQGLVAHKPRQARHSTAFHFKISHLEIAITEGFNLGILLGVGQRQTEFTTLRTKKSATGHSDATHHIGGRYAADEFVVGADAIGVTDASGALPAHGGEELLFETEVANAVAAGIEVEQAVEADALDTGHEGAFGCFGLEATTGAYAHDFKTAQRGFDGSAGEVDVGERVNLVEHDVNVVTANTGRHHGDALAGIGAGDGVKLATLHVALAAVKMSRHRCHTAGVAHKDDLGGQMLGQKMKMKHRPIGIDDEFGGRKKRFHGKGVMIVLSQKTKRKKDKELVSSLSILLTLRVLRS